MSVCALTRLARITPSQARASEEYHTRRPSTTPGNDLAPGRLGSEPHARQHFPLAGCGGPAVAAHGGNDHRSRRSRLDPIGQHSHDLGHIRDPAATHRDPDALTRLYRFGELSGSQLLADSPSDIGQAWRLEILMHGDEIGQLDTVQYPVQ